MSSALAKARVLVSGGAGFIGCALANRMAPFAGRYLVLDNLHPQVHAIRERPAALHPSAEFMLGDVTMASCWDEALTRIQPDIVIHLAAETGTGQSLTEASRHGSVNVVGTTQLTDSLGRHQIRPRQIILSSSRAVYGEGAWRSAGGELVYPGQRTRKQLQAGQWDFSDMSFQPATAASTHPSPSSVYGATKLTQEHVLSAWCGALSVPLSILRFQNVYGPGQSLTNSYTGIVALFCRLARAGSSIPLYEDGAVTRDFVFIDDVADAVVSAVRCPPADRRICDVGSGRATTIAQLAGLIAQAYGAPAPHLCGKFRDGDVRHASCDIAATKESLEWTPHWPLERGLSALRDWIDRELPPV